MSDVAQRARELLERNADEAASELLGITTTNQNNELANSVELNMAKLMEVQRLVEDSKPQLFIELHENPNLLVVHHEPRSWRERLLTRPWRPWQRTRRVYLPDPHIYKYPAAGLDGYNVEFWFAHPATANCVRKMAREQGIEL